MAIKYRVTDRRGKICSRVKRSIEQQDRSIINRDFSSVKNLRIGISQTLYSRILFSCTHKIEQL